jgi:hypothetical protein
MQTSGSKLSREHFMRMWSDVEAVMKNCFATGPLRISGRCKPCQRGWMEFASSGGLEFECVGTSNQRLLGPQRNDWIGRIMDIATD